MRHTLWSLVWLATILHIVDAQIFGITTCNTDIPTKYDFDVNQYLGKWYEVRRYYPVFFEFNLKCGVAQYALKENDYIEVSNTGTERLTGIRQDPVIGEAFMVNKTIENASKLYVSFGPENSDTAFSEIFDGTGAKTNGNYWVLDTDYVTFAIVYSCISLPGVGRTEIVWLLGREPQIPQETMDNIYALLEQYKIKTKYLFPVEQSCGV